MSKQKWQLLQFLRRRQMAILILQIHFGLFFKADGQSSQNNERLMMFTTFAHISDYSWQQWRQFKAETCRQNSAEEEDNYVAERALNSTEHAYFHWEQGEFHRQLRQRLMPETGGGNLRPLIGSPLLNRLDPRLFGSEPKSLCQLNFRSEESLEEEQRRIAKEEQALFEDSIIDRVFPHLPDAYEGNGGEEYDYFSM